MVLSTGGEPGAADALLSRTPGGDRAHNGGRWLGRGTPEEWAGTRELVTAVAFLAGRGHRSIGDGSDPTTNNGLS